MRFFSLPFFVALLGLTEAAPKPKSRQTKHHTSTKVSHQTELALEPYHGHVPTVTVTRTQTLPPVVVIFTTHPTVTKTPAVVTDTKTKFVKSTTSVTAAANTDTVCVTTTEFDTTTRTHTPPVVTSTVCTDTTITTTSTSNIPTANGFTPVVDTLPTYIAVKKEQRDLESLERRSKVITPKEFQYAKSVKRIEEVFVEVIIIEIIVGPAVTKWLPAHTTCVTKTDTISVTSTIVPPDVSATITDTITSTVCVGTTLPAETDTVTSTNTATASVVNTAYDACATNNIAVSPLSPDYGRFAGQDLAGFVPYQSEFSTTRVQSNGPYDCCVACAQDSSCVIASYEVGACFIFSAARCDPSENELTAYLAPGGFTGFSLSNGACGHVVGREEYI